MMDRVTELIAQYFRVAAGELSIDAVPMGILAAQYGTPLFVYSRSVLDYKWHLLRQTLPAQFAISYSVKANPNHTLLQYFVAKGCGLEIASGGEFYHALRAGCPPQQMLFAGPGKTEAELALVLSHGIGEIHVESLLEAQRIGALSRQLGVRARVVLRINPSAEAQGGAMRMGGKPAPFGIDEEQLDPALDHILSDPTLEFRGIHLFTGTQILDYTVILGQYRKGLSLAKHVAKRLQRPVHTVDFGGGFGIPYFASEQAMDMEKLRLGLAALMEEIKGDTLLAGVQFVVEPGRYLVGEVGIYVTRITDIKVSRGKKYLVVDGGMHHHLAASGNLGQVIKRNFPVAVLNRLDALASETVDVVGPLCTPLDVLARDLPIPAVEVGDLLGVFQSGAYARTASPLGFLSRLTPAEVLAQEGKTYLIRRHGTYDDLLRDTLDVDGAHG